MSAPVATIDDERLTALSVRLGIPARQLLIAAARLAQAERALSNDPAYRERVLQDAKNQSAAAESAARLLLTPPPDYSTDELDRLFAGLWPESAHRGEG